MSNVISKGLESNCTHQYSFFEITQFQNESESSFYDSISKWVLKMFLFKKKLFQRGNVPPINFLWSI